MYYHTIASRAIAHLVLFAVAIAVALSSAHGYVVRWSSLIAVLLLANRDTFLPFLGPTAMPTSIFETAAAKPRPPTSAMAMISAPQSATHCIYWASRQGSYSSWVDAYGAYPNAGVSPVTNGTATLSLAECPGTYSVDGVAGYTRTLPRHIHYRFVDARGMVSPVMTVSASCA